MTGDERKPPFRDPAEERSLKLLRYITAGVILTMIVLVVTVDTLGRLFIDPNFHASDIILGTLVGALLPILGVISLIKWPPRGNGS